MTPRAAHRAFYYVLILFLGLGAYSSLIEAIIRFKIGSQLFSLKSFFSWFLLQTALSLIVFILLTWYLQYRKYHAAVKTGIAFIIGQFLFAISCTLLLKGFRIMPLYLVTYYIMASIAIIFGCTLIFSKAGEKKWLKTSGILILVIYAALIGVLIMIGFNGYRDTVLAENISAWMTLVSILIPFSFIMHFTGEIKLLKNEAPETARLRAPYFLFIVMLTSLCFTIFLGILMINETTGRLRWLSVNNQKVNDFKQDCEAGMYKDGKGGTLKYLLMKPLKNDTAMDYPMVVCLPYDGYECPAVWWLSDYNVRRKHPAFVFVPFCPKGQSWGGIPHYPTIDSLVIKAMLDLERKNPIDTERIYITGLSKGGYGTWHFISLRPDMFAAAIPVCGAGDPAMAPRITGVAIWAFHGAKDRNVPVSGSRNMIAAIKRAGGDPKYTEYPALGHDIWAPVMHTTGLLDWLFDQKK